MMGVCYIIGAGEMHGAPEPCEHDFVIAADGGYDAARSLDIMPDLLIGDMDSIGAVPKGVDILRVPVEKDETDTYLCYREGVRRGYTDFVIYGGVGGRDDHTFANYSLLIGAKNDGNRVTLVGECFNIFAIKNEKISIKERVGAMLSVFAFSGECHGVTIRGCKYNTDSVTLSPAFPLGVSNEITETDASIEVADGVLLIMIEK